MPPLLSVCIPTLGRPDLLDYMLKRLHAWEGSGWEIEVVVSDNAPSEATEQVVQSHRKFLSRLRYCKQFHRVEPYEGAMNAFRNAASLLRLTSAVLSEISDDWETERAYLTMEAR